MAEPEFVACECGRVAPIKAEFLDACFVCPDCSRRMIPRERMSASGAPSARGRANPRRVAKVLGITAFAIVAILGVAFATVKIVGAIACVHESVEWRSVPQSVKQAFAWRTTLSREQKEAVIHRIGRGVYLAPEVSIARKSGLRTRVAHFKGSADQCYRAKTFETTAPLKVKQSNGTLAILTLSERTLASFAKQQLAPAVVRPLDGQELDRALASEGYVYLASEEKSKIAFYRIPFDYFRTETTKGAQHTWRLPPYFEQVAPPGTPLFTERGGLAAIVALEDGEGIILGSSHVRDFSSEFLASYALTTADQQPPVNVSKQSKRNSRVTSIVSSKSYIVTYDRDVGLVGALDASSLAVVGSVALGDGDVRSIWVNSEEDRVYAFCERPNSVATYSLPSLNRIEMRSLLKAPKSGCVLPDGRVVYATDKEIIFADPANNAAEYIMGQAPRAHFCLDASSSMLFVASQTSAGLRVTVFDCTGPFPKLVTTVLDDRAHYAKPTTFLSPNMKYLVTGGTIWETANMKLPVHRCEPGETMYAILDEEGLALGSGGLYNFSTGDHLSVGAGKKVPPLNGSVLYYRPRDGRLHLWNEETRMIDVYSVGLMHD